LIRTNNDEEPNQRIGALKSTFDKLQQGKELKGYTGLSQILSYEDLQKLVSLFKKPLNPPVLPFPLDIFPKQIANILREYSESLQCPIDFLAVPLLVEVGVAIGNTIEIEIKGGYIEGTSIYGAVVGDPGSKKSPALKLMMNPIRNIQNKMEKKYEEQLEIYYSELSNYENEMKRWKKEENTS